MMALGYAPSGAMRTENDDDDDDEQDKDSG